MVPDEVSKFCGCYQFKICVSVFQRGDLFAKRRWKHGLVPCSPFWIKWTTYTNVVVPVFQVEGGGGGGITGNTGSLSAFAIVVPLGVEKI